MAVTTSVVIGAAGLAVSAASAGKSFYDAAQSKDAAAKAQAEAGIAMAAARSKLDKNFYEQIGIPKEAYMLQSEAALSAGAQAIQAGAESERGIAATAGRIQAQQNEAQAGIRTDMGNTMLELDKLTAQEDSRLRDVGVGIDLAEAGGAQMAARDATEAAAAQTAQGFASVTSGVQQGLEMVPLYQKSAGLKSLNAAEKDYYAASEGADFDKKYIDSTTNKPMDFYKALSMQSGYEGVNALDALKRQDYLITNSKGLKGMSWNTAKKSAWDTYNPSKLISSPKATPVDPNYFDYNAYVGDYINQ